MREDITELAAAICRVIEKAIIFLTVVIALAVVCSWLDNVIDDWKNAHCYCSYY